MSLETIPEEVAREILALQQQNVKLHIREQAREEFMPFVHHVYLSLIHI